MNDFVDSLLSGEGSAAGRPPRVSAARTPTPLEPLRRASERLGLDLWIKRDDLTGFALGGNKVRKLEFSVAAALERGCDTLLTCGGFDSNHCRATAFLARRHGLRPVLYLRTADGGPVARWQGNTLLDAIAGGLVGQAHFKLRRNSRSPFSCAGLTRPTRCSSCGPHTAL